jgi:hypothetical protein
VGQSEVFGASAQPLSAERRRSCRQLIAAKDALDHDEFEAMVERDLPFQPSTAQRLMKIAADRGCHARWTGGPEPIASAGA